MNNFLTENSLGLFEIKKGLIKTQELDNKILNLISTSKLVDQYKDQYWSRDNYISPNNIKFTYVHDPITHSIYVSKSNINNIRKILKTLLWNIN